MAEVYGNLVIFVTLVMEGVDRAVTYSPTMHHRHALYDSRRVTGGGSYAQPDGHGAVLGSLYESYRGFVS